MISSTLSGKQGEIAYDTGTTGLSLSDMSVAHDAVVAVTDGTSPNPIVVSSSTNTVTGIADGLTLNLLSASPQAVNVSVAQDTSTILSDVHSFVDAVNQTLTQIDTLTSYDPTTNTKGDLLGDYTVEEVRDSLVNQINRTISGSGVSFTNLTQLGITVDTSSISTGDNKLQFTVDDSKFTQALQQDPDSVQKLFTLVTTDSSGKAVNQGIAAQLNDVLTTMTQSPDGLLGAESQTLQNRLDMLNSQATEMQALLSSKQAQLYNQFNAMEQALAQLQSQQSALSSLTDMASAASSTSSTS